jgi:nucleosome binding factor SPN SPT16 subunit
MKIHQILLYYSTSSSVVVVVKFTQNNIVKKKRHRVFSWILIPFPGKRKIMKMEMKMRLSKEIESNHKIFSYLHLYIFFKIGKIAKYKEAKKNWKFLP